MEGSFQSVKLFNRHSKLQNSFSTFLLGNNYKPTINVEGKGEGKYIVQRLQLYTHDQSLVCSKVLELIINQKFSLYKAARLFQINNYKINNSFIHSFFLSFFIQLYYYKLGSSPILYHYLPKMYIILIIK